MELFLLARFARLCECMGKEEEAFLWYDELAAYLCKVPKDRADTGKLYPLLCYRMAKNRLRRIFGENMWWEEGRCKGIYSDPIKSLMPILKGKATPKPQKLQMLQKRLKMEWKMYDPGFITEEDKEYKKFARMFRMYGDGKFEEGRELLYELEEKIDWKYMINEQFGIYWDALFEWKERKITEEEKNQEMWRVVEYSGVKREKFAEVGCALMEISWNYGGGRI